MIVTMTLKQLNLSQKKKNPQTRQNESSQPWLDQEALGLLDNDG